MLYTQCMGNIVFLFGSGISRKAGMPCTQQITDKVLSGLPACRETDEHYYTSSSVNQDDCYVKAVREFLHFIKIWIDFYYSVLPVKNTNYEDIYYVSKQIYDGLTGEFDNPLIKSFLDRYWLVLETIFEESKYGRGNRLCNWNSQILAREACHYIADMVYESVDPLIISDDLSYLNVLLEPINNITTYQIDVFTTNYDLVLEKFFEKNGRSYIDGFGTQQPVRRFNPELYKQSNAKVRLFKLHGSVNWFRFRYKDDKYTDHVGIHAEGEIRHNTIAVDLYRDGWWYDRRPLILIGTYNKMLEYTSGIFTSLLCNFHDSLNSTKILIVSGYSFGDKGINSIIIDWLYSSRDNKLIIIHPDEKQFLYNTRGSITKNWATWKKNLSVAFIENKIEHCQWSDISPYIVSSASCSISNFSRLLFKASSRFFKSL